MWAFLRSISDTVGVGFLAMQLVKLIGVVFTLLGPLKWISSLFEGIFPYLAKFFAFSFGWSINGLDVMAVSIAVSGTCIVASSIATHGAMGTKYIFRFLMIPYAFLIIILAIVVQVMTPMVELGTFHEACRTGQEAAGFYGSACSEMTAQLAFFDGIFGEAASSVSAEASDDEAGLSFIFALLYLILVLPLVAVIVFFFKRLSINKLLKRVSLAIVAAIGLSLASAGIAMVTG